LKKTKHIYDKQNRIMIHVVSVDNGKQSVT